MTLPYIKSGQKGFTVMELIVVLLILAILGLVMYPKMQGRELSSKISSTEIQILRWYEAAKAYMVNHGTHDFTGATKANLVAEGLIPDASNPFGNAYTVGPKTGDAAQLEVSCTTDTAASATAIKDRLVAKGYTATTAAAVLTVNMGL